MMLIYTKGANMLMDKIVGLSLIVIVVGTFYVTGKALQDLNDGRVANMVESMVK